MRYSFGEYEFDEGTHELLHNGERVRVEPQVALLLELLIQERDRIVSKSEIIEVVWGDRTVSDASVDNRISAARAAIGDSGREQRLIKTFPVRGFQFVGPVLAIDCEAAQEIEAEPAQSSGQMAVSGGVAPSADESDALVTAGPGESATTSDEPSEPRLSRPLAVFASVFAAALVAVILSLSATFTSSGTTAQTSNAQPYEAAVAVLPFREVGGQYNQTYLGEGLAHELASVLTQIDGLKVSSSSSAFRFTGESGETLPEMAGTLGVTHIVEGSFAQVGSSLKVTVHLVDAANDDRIWTETYARPYNPSNIVRVQEQIVSAIVAEMLGELTAPSQLPTVKTQSARALDLYYRAQTLRRAQDKDSLTQAIALLKQATEIDPEYVDPYSLLVLAYDDAYAIAGMSWEESVEGRQKALEKAMELAPNDPQVLIGLAMRKSDDGDSREAIALYQKALAANPNDSFTLAALAIAYSQLGRRDEELAFYRKARDVDPLSPSVLQGLTISEYSHGDAKAALEIAKTNMRWNSDNPIVQESLAWVLMGTGDYPAAQELFASALEQSPDHDQMAQAASDLYLRVGWDKEAQEVVSGNRNSQAVVDALLGKRAEVERYLAVNPDPDVIGNSTGVIRFYLGDFEMALPYLKRTLEDLEVLGPAGVSHADMLWFIAHAHVLCALKDLDCDVLLEKIEEPIAGRTPKTAETYDVFVTAAGVNALRGNEDAAIDWLEAAFEAGHTFVHLKHHPTFAALADNPRYAALRSKMEAKAKTYRGEFEDKLAVALN